MTSSPWQHSGKLSEDRMLFSDRNVICDHRMSRSTHETEKAKIRMEGVQASSKG